MTPRPTEPLAASGALLVVVALAIIWSARATVPGGAYVSELGAAGMPTEAWLEAALLFIVVGGGAIAWTGRHLRSTLLRRCTPAAFLWIGCAFFLLASQVTCTAGCPLPIGDTFTWQDFVHTVSAVLAFSAACLAMLQVAFDPERVLLARFSLTAAAAVTLSATAGGALSLARVESAAGGILELIATTIAIGWLAVLGGVLSWQATGVRSAPHDGQQLVG